MAKQPRKFITEIFDDIQSDEKNIELYLTNTTVKAVFEYTYNPEKKWLLPESDPPYRPAPEPLGMTPTNLLMSVRTWPNFSRTDLTTAKRESMYINLLEGVFDGEALLLNAIKNGKISKLYPFATRAFGEKHGLIQPLPKTEKPVKEPKTPKEPKEPKAPRAKRTPKSPKV